MSSSGAKGLNKMANIRATEIKRFKPICVDNEGHVGIGYKMLDYRACLWKVSIDSRAVAWAQRCSPD